MAETLVNCIGLSVSGHPGGSPNKSRRPSSSSGVYRRRDGSIRIWQRSAIVSIRCPLVSLIRRVSEIVGITAYRSAWAPMQSKVRSATSVLPGQLPGPGADRAEEIIDAVPGFAAPVEPAPGQPHPAGQFVTGIDGHQEVLDAVLALGDQDRLHVVFHGRQQRGP